MKDLLFVSMSRAVIVGAQLVYVKLYSNILSNHELGLYFFLNTVSYSLNACYFVPIDYYQQSKLYGYVKNNVSLKSLVIFNRRCVSLAVAATLVSALICSFFQLEYAIYALMAGGLSIAVYLGTALKGALNNLEHRRFIASIMAIEAILKVALFYLFVMVLPRQATTLVLSSIAALLLALAPAVWLAKGLPEFKSGAIERIDSSDVFWFGYPVSIGAAVNWIQLQGYRMILVPLGFAEMVGIYATVSGIGNAGTAAVSSIFGQVFLPKIYKTAGKYTKTYLWHALLLITGLCVFCSIFSGFLVTLLTKEEFRKFSWLLLYGVIAEGGNFLVGAFSIQLTLISQTKKMLNGTLLCLLSAAGSFGLLFSLKLVNIYTIGLPIILSQVLVTLYLYSLFRRKSLAQTD
jgi:O-antigen/teichoic acid export membrane protein